MNCIRGRETLSQKGFLLKMRLEEKIYQRYILQDPCLKEADSYPARVPFLSKTIGEFHLLILFARTINLNISFAIDGV